MSGWPECKYVPIRPPLPERWQPFQQGDVVYLGEGVTWQLSRSLADFLNRNRARQALSQAPR